MGLSNLVGKEINELKSLNYFDLYNSQVDRLNNIVIALGKHSTLSMSDWEPEEFSFEHIIDSILYPFQDNIVSDNISVSKVITTNTYVGNRFAIQTILQSLLENSIHFRSNFRASLISIEIQEVNKELLIEISDNGIGIDPEHQENIFQMFFRAHDNSRGSGLGLYLFSTALRKLRGRFKLESAVDRGTRFMVNVPCDQSHLKRK